MNEEISKEFKKVIEDRKKRIFLAEQSIKNTPHTLEDMHYAIKFTDRVLNNDMSDDGFPSGFKLNKRQQCLFELLIDIEFSKKAIALHEQFKSEDNIPNDMDINVGGFSFRRE